MSKKYNFLLNKNILITERGTMFGYQDLIVDYRAIPIMQSFTYPVILDITHSLQEPNTNSGITGGKPKMIETIAKAGVAVGVDGIFLETHFNPSIAKSDSKNMLDLNRLEDLLIKLLKIKREKNRKFNLIKKRSRKKMIRIEKLLFLIQTSKERIDRLFSDKFNIESKAGVLIGFGAIFFTAS